jgi:hypothetical protein
MSVTTLARRAISILAVTSAASVGLIIVQAPAHAAFTSSVGGPINRSEVIERAQYWVDHQPGLYNSDASSPDPTGSRNYRRDCSGYVDMSWHINGDNWTGNLDQISYQISRSDLAPGDVLNDAAEHVILFDSWAPDHEHFSYYSFGSTPVKHITNADINQATFDSHPNSAYVARRYDDIVDDSVESVVPPSTVAASNDPDGRLEVFVSRGGAVAHRWQSTPNGPLGGWYSMGGSAPTGLATAVNADGRLQLFTIGSGGALYSDWQTTVNGAWSGWNNLGGTQLQSVTTGYNADGSIQVFALGGDGSMYSRWQTAPNGSFADWYDFGGTELQSLSAASNADGTLQVFALGGDGAVYSMWQDSANGPLGAWQKLGGTALRQISVATNSDGTLQVFALGGDGALYSTWQDSANGSFGDWFNFGGNVRQIAATVNADAAIEVFALGTDGAVYSISQDGPSGPLQDWVDLGGSGMAGNLTTAHNVDGSIQVFATNAVGSLISNWQDGPNGDFGSWVNFG